MKGRSFLLALAATAMVLLTLALGVWWAMARQSPLRLVDQPLALPRAARFMPRDAALTLHWLVDPRQVPAYAQAVAPVRQRRLVNESTRQLRDGAFALAGLDFSSELAGWIGPEVSLAVLQAPSPQVGAPPADGWVLALSSRDEDGAKRFLQRFWQTRSLAGTNLQISRYRGMGLISGRGALLGRDPQPIATALIDDDLLLLASGRGVLEQATTVNDVAALCATLLAEFPTVLADFNDMRAREGAALAQVLEAQLTQVAELTTQAAALAETRKDEMAQTLQRNLSRVLDNAEGVDADRLAQELALIAVKSDITEEIDRLHAHVDAARALLAQDGAVGRKLDFLMQEFNREANTLCAKAQSTALTQIGLALKAVIDQMREQVQNVE